jgi:hypothetical protein
VAEASRGKAAARSLEEIPITADGDDGIDLTAISAFVQNLS